MRTTEGVGLVPPRPVRVRIGLDGLALARRLAWQRVNYRRYGDRADKWGQGLMGDAFMPVLVGFAGELALSQWVEEKTGIRAPVDAAPRPGGDGGVDFYLGPYQVQLKTAASAYDELLVRTSAIRDPDAVAWQIFVRAQWAPRVANGGAALFDPGECRDRTVVELRGWAWGDTLFRRGVIEPGRGGDHFNYVLAPKYFQPMTELADLLVARTSLQGVA